jgi:BA14K-like protein
MKKIIMLVGFVTLLASPVLAQAPAGVYGTGNIVFPGDPAAAAAAGAYSTIVLDGLLGVFAYEPAPSRGGNCARRFRSYDPHSGTYLGYDGHRYVCR